MEKTVLKYLKQLGIPVSEAYCKQLIRSHPDYPSLLSIADALQRLGINHNVVRLSNDRLVDVPAPYLVKPAEGRRNLTTIEEKNDLTQYLENTEQEHSVIMQVQPTDAITDEEHNRQQKEERFLKVMAMAALVAVGGLLVLVLLQTVTWFYAVLLCTALAGTAVGYVLYARELEITYDQVEQFCHAGRKTNCDVILNSEAAKLFGTVTMSDLTVSYFLFQMLTLGVIAPLSGELSSYNTVLSLFSMLSIPGIIFSLYYQAIQTETWCRLCLLVDGVLAVQAGLFGYMVTNGTVTFSIDIWLPVIGSVFVFIAVGAGLMLLKKTIEKKNKAIRTSQSAKRVKYDPVVFLHLWSRQDTVAVRPFEEELIIGDLQAPVKILMAASLGCGPCKKGFEKAIQLVTRYPGRVSLALRFRKSGSGKNGDPVASDYLIGYWQRHIHGKSGESEQTKQLVRAWYEQRNLKAFMKQYPIEAVKGNSTTELAEKHYRWFKQAEIKATPSFFINGRPLPKQYRMGDLMILVPALGEYFGLKEISSKKLA